MNSQAPFKYKRQLYYESIIAQLESAGFTYTQARAMLSIWIDIAGQIPLEFYEN
jgi:hypothetical protein